MVSAFFMKGLGGEETDGLRNGGLEKPAIFGVGGAVGRECLAKGEEC